MRKRLLSWLLVLVMVFSMIPSTLVTALAADTLVPDETWNLSSGISSKTVQNGKTYLLQGSGQGKIVVPDGVTATFMLSNITLRYTESPIQVEAGGSLTIILMPGTTNTITCTAADAGGVKQNNSYGKTAGISVPNGATLNIQAAPGSQADATFALNVTGGYGGAGIGGSVQDGYEQDESLRAPTGSKGEKGEDGYKSTVNQKISAGGDGENGGKGGLQGKNGGDAGTISVSGVTLTVTGGYGAAGIGGGLGADGQKGDNGAEGIIGETSDFYTLPEHGQAVYRGTTYTAAVAGAGGTSGGGGGGTGGIGGTGGNLTSLTITDATVTAKGGEGAAGIGGGRGGNGGAGGTGGTANKQARSSQNSKQHNASIHDFIAISVAGSGGTGGTGNPGVGGNGGAGGTVSVTNSTVNADGFVGIGGGNVGTDDTTTVAAQPTAGGTNTSHKVDTTAVGMLNNETTQGSKDNVDRLWWYKGSGGQSWDNYIYGIGQSGNGGAGGAGGAASAPNSVGANGTLIINKTELETSSNVGARPQNEKGVSLYRAVITAVKKSDNSPLPGALVNYKKGGVAYGATANTEGKATIWLPLGNHVLKDSDVTSGDMMIADRTPLNVTADDNAQVTVKLDLGLVLTAPTDKVYVDAAGGTTPAEIGISVPNLNVTKIQWLAEPITGDKEYGSEEDLLSGTIAFDTGYTTAAHKGEFDATAGNGSWTLNVGANGRYWIQVIYQGADGNSGKIVGSVDVTNIYTRYAIQVRDKELNRDGSDKRVDAYEPLKNALGQTYTGNYGFAWDLDGEATKTLVPTPSAGYDTVQVYANSSKVKWYNAFFGTKQTPVEKNDAKNGFKAVELTLNQDFLKNNQDADAENDVVDPSKYTITYTPEGVPVAEVTIRGVVLEDDGTELKELWSYDNSYPEGVTEADINGFKQDGYRIDKVLINGAERAGVTLTGNSIHLTDLQGTQENNYTDAIEKVEFVYVNNMVDVTVKAMYNGKELQSTTISLEKGVQMTVSAPSIEGYTADEASQTYTPVDGTNTITFQYTKDAGNVTVVAVDQNGNTEIYRKDGGTVSRGDKIDLTGDAKAPTIEYYTTPSVPKSVTVNGVAVADLDTYNYNGVGDIVVTYEYARKTQDITIVKKDVATGGEIDKQTLPNLPVGESHTFLAGDVSVPANYEATADRNPTTYFVEDKAGQTVTFWYKNTSDSQYAQVTVNLICNGEIFQTYPVTAVKGVLTTIKAPDVRGYNINGDAAKSITPTGVDDVVEFTYTINNPKTVNVELKTNSDATNPDAKLNAPAGYTESYTLKDGDSITIWAPTLEGYALRGATLNGADQTDMQPVTVDYANLPDGTSTVVFRYLPVAQANFVTHTIKFMLGAQELYSYEKMVAKGTGNQVSYPADAVADMVPGYVYSETTYEVGGVTVGAEAVKDNANAVIIYHFKEDTAKITIKFQDANGAQLKSGGAAVADQVLTGYRKGQTIEVPAPVLNGFALAPNEALIKTVNLSATDANTEVAFKYVPLANTYFILKEKLADGTEKIITFINAKENTKYDPNEKDNPLDLSAFGYSFTTDADKVGTDVSDEFKAGGAGSVTTGATLDNKTYTLYYVKGVRSVEFVPVDKDKLDADNKTLDAVIQDGTVDTYKIDGLTPAPMEDARIGETYKASAQSFNGWALKDDFTKLYKVETGNGPLKVYFLYAAKSLGDVTVHYHFGDSHNAGKLLNEYTIKAVVGEKVSITAPEYLLDNKYHLKDGQTNPVVLEVTATQNEVEFYYEANFVNVTTKVVLDGGSADTHETYEVIKNTGSQTLYPPEKAGYTLVGITADGATLTGGAADKLPAEYTNNRLTLTGLTADATVTYYYKTTKASEYQTALTVEYKYNGYDLAASKTVNANTGDDNSIDVPAFDGYKATTYTFKDGTGADTTSGINGTSVTVNPKEKTATLTITYVRTDSSVVLPGKDNKFPAPDDKDNITVTPDDANKLPEDTGDGSGSVKVPDGTTATVTRPTDPDQPEQGSENITVPGGSVIKPDGTIVLPDKGGEIAPGQKIPENLPNGYVAITYDSNNGTKEVKKEIGKANELKVRGELFKHPTNAKFVSWNDSGLGSGTTYTEGQTVSASITLYAKWSASYTYSANITYKPNGGTPDTDEFRIVGHDTDPKLAATLIANPYQVSGWNFGGWNEQANGTGTLYQAGANLTLADGDAKTLYAQWYKVNADGSITVPGKDGNPNTAGDNATANGNGTENPSRNDKGEIEIPKGGSVTQPDGTVIGMPDGGILKPDGTVVIKRPDGGTITIPGKDGTNPDVTDKDGNEEQNKTVVTLTYLINNGENDEVKVKAVQGDEVAAINNPFTWAGRTFVNWIRESDSKEFAAGDKFTVDGEETFHAQWTKKNADGSIELPGKDGSLETDADNVIVTPVNPGTLEGPKADGSVEVKDGEANVNRPIDPDHPENGRENIKVPEGTVVKPDGTIELPNGGGTINPGDKLPENTPDGYLTVTYKANGGIGDDVKQLVKADSAKAMANPFSNRNGAAFIGWNTQQNGIGGTSYGAGDEITVADGTKSLVLYAQWGEKTYTNSATIIYKANGGTGADVTATVGADDNTSFNAALAENPFTPPTGWTFTGWNTKADGNGTHYAASAIVQLNKDDTLTLFAQWVKKNADGSITVPGGDNKPATDDDVTVKPKPGETDPDKQPSVDGDGNVKVPEGGSVVTPDKEIELPGGGTVKPDGTIVIPDPTDPSKPGTEVKPGDQNPPQGYYTVTYVPGAATGNKPIVRYVQEGTSIKVEGNRFVYDGHVFAYWSDENGAKVKKDDTINDTAILTANWLVQKEDGTIVVPDPDNKPDGTIEIKPNPDGTDPDNKPKVDDEGNVIVPPGGEVEKKPSGGSVILPDGGKVTNPEGDIKIPDGNGGETTVDPNDPSNLPDGYFLVEYRSNDASAQGTMPKQMGKTSVKALESRFSLTGSDFLAWNTEADGTGVEYAPGADIDAPADGSKSVILYAQWKSKTGMSFTVNVKFYKDGDKSERKTQTISGTGTQTTAALAANTFTAPETGWNFFGWNTKADGTGTFYADNANVLFKNDSSDLELYAIWYKQDGDNVVIPGQDGKPGTGDDITVKPNPDDPNGEKPAPDGSGSIKVPDGGQVVIPGANTPDDDKTITVTPGASVTPDGTITLPDGGEAKIEPDGTTITGPAVINPDGTVDNPDKDKPFRPGDGTIVLPGKDGETGTDDDVVVTPGKDADNKDNSTIKPDGSVELPDGGKVKYPDAPDGNGSTITVPGGTVVQPDGTIVLPDGGDAKVEPDGPVIPGGSEIGPDGEVKSYAYTVKFDGVSRADEIVKIAKGAQRIIDAPAINGYDVDKTSVTVIGGDLVDGGYVITFKYTKTSGGTSGGGGGGGGSVSFTIKASAGANGSISPSGSVSVKSGSDKVFTFSADNGYTVADVLVDGKSVGAVNSYVFSNVTGNHTISVTFKAAKPASGVADPSETGVANWLRVTEHTAYLSGFGNGKFGPNENMTRAQVAQMFYNLLLDKNVPVTTNFSDVPADAWYAQAVNTLASLGIVKGTGEGIYAPNRTITRAEFAVIAMRFAKASATVTNPFTDVASSDWYYNAVTSAVSYGWINGYSDGTFRPQATITRAEVATIVNRMLNRTADRDFVNSNTTTHFDDVSITYWAYYNIMEATTSHSHTIDNDGVETWNGLK